MKAIIVGATGATGKDLLHLIINDDFFERIDIFVRRQPDVSSKKLQTHIIDFDKPQTWKHFVQGNVLFSCLGTTLKAAGSKEAQWKIDFDYQYNFAKAARENGVPHYVLVSSGMASSKSKIFYTRMKGELEDAINALQFPKLTIFNPPILERKNSDRAAEVLGLKMIKLLNKAGILASQKPLPTEHLAQAMIITAKTQTERFAAYNPSQIIQLLKTPAV